jgi:tRNA(fMet)-specific endonuclease VapC
VHVLCELEAGVQLARHPERERARLHDLLEGIAIVYPDERFAGVYARTFTALARRGKRMPAMDLLIAVAALADRATLVTPNLKDFRSVPDVVGY